MHLTVFNINEIDMGDVNTYISYLSRIFGLLHFDDWTPKFL